VAFAPDDRTLVSDDGDWDRPGEVKLWETGAWRERAARQHTGEVLCLAYAPDGRTLAAGSWDRTVQLWDLTPGEASP
jgi:WD40 repeat protein